MVGRLETIRGRMEGEQSVVSGNPHADVERRAWLTQQPPTAFNRHSQSPQPQADYLAEYAEWLIGSGTNDNETAEDVLLSAADCIMEFDMGEGGWSVD